MSRTRKQQIDDQDFLKEIETELTQLKLDTDKFENSEDRKQAKLLLDKHIIPTTDITGIIEHEMVNKLYNGVEPYPTFFSDARTNYNIENIIIQYNKTKIQQMKTNYELFSDYEKKVFSNFYEKYKIIQEKNEELYNRINKINDKINDKINVYGSRGLGTHNIFQNRELRQLRNYDVLSLEEKILLSNKFNDIINAFFEIVRNPDEIVRKPDSTGGKRRNTRRRNRKSKRTRKSRNNRRKSKRRSRR